MRVHCRSGVADFKRGNERGKGMAQHKLSAAGARAAKPGKHSDGGGLWLYKTERAGSWVFRYTVNRKRRELGLGPFPDLSLAAARKKAETHRKQLAEGLDPLAERDKQKFVPQQTTFEAIAREAFEAYKATLKADGKAGRWFSPLRLHVLPRLGHMDIRDIDQNLVRDVITPLWQRKQPTAEKALNRINICIRYAAAKGLDVNVATIPHVKILLGKGQHEVQHIPAMDWREVPEFYATLGDLSVTHLALRLAILSPGQRSRPLREMKFDQVVDGVWTIPGMLMKGKRGKTDDFQVPLSHQALEVIESARHLTTGDYVFPGRTARVSVISDATLSKYMRDCGLNSRPHGFRSSFSTWARETGQRDDIREMCLAHKVGSDVERSYMRSDLMAERREMMQRWSDWVVARRS